MVARAARERARRDIARDVHRGLRLADLARAVSRSLGRAVPFEGSCVLSLDPATLLPTGEVVEDGLPPWATPRLTEIELGGADYNAFRALARGPHPAASLGAATDGRLERSVRQRELRAPNGFGDELRVALVGPTGTWGALTLLREAARPAFTDAEVALVSSLAGPLAEGVRRAMLLEAATAAAAATAASSEPDVGLVLLAPDDSVELADAPAARWLDELSALGEADAGRLPVVVRAVAADARRAARSSPVGELAEPADHPGRPTGAWARVRTRTGRWLVARGSVLGEGAAARTAVLLESARASELGPLLADAYGLTERERRITELVARGCSTTEVAARLHLSAYTVQDHLKSIFEKSGTGSRRELVARFFVDVAAPRLSTGGPPR